MHGKLAYKPCLKPSSQKQYLNSSSMHTPGVHFAWPLAEVGRMFKRSWNHRTFLESRMLLISRFRAALLDDAVLQACENWSPYSAHPVKRHRAVMWIAVSYHPRIYVPLERALSLLIRQWQDKGYRFPFLPQISWTRANRNLIQNVQCAAIEERGGRWVLFFLLAFSSWYPKLK